MSDLVSCRQCDLSHPAATRKCPFTGAPIDEPPARNDAGRISTASLTPLCGTVVNDKYYVDKLLGSGGSAAVYLATHEQIGKRVALKVLLRHEAADEGQRHRFLREARSTGQLYHANIVRVFDVGFLEDGSPYIVVEHLEGETLAAKLARERRIPPVMAVDLATQTLDGLDEAHRSGIVHRDIKPDNLFIAKGPQAKPIVKLLDFGLSKVLNDSLSTSHGRVMGTPFFLAPEQALALGDLDARVDLWAVGVVMYQMVSGELPFDGKNIAELALNIVRDAPIPPSSHRRGLPADVEAVILKALQKDRDDRYATAFEMAEALRGVDFRRRANVPDTLVDQKRLPAGTTLDGLAATIPGVGTGEKKSS